MWTFISVISALVINFYTPKIPDSKHKLHTTYLSTRSFPFQYFEDEVLTNEQIKYRFRIIYINSLILITVICSSVSGVAPSHAMGLPIKLPIEQPAIMKSIDSYTPKKIIIARVLQSSPDKIIFTERQMDQFYELAQKYANGAMSSEELIYALRGGNFDNWIAALECIMAMIVLITNMNVHGAFINLQNQNVIVTPNGSTVRPANGGKFQHPKQPKVGGRFTLRMSNSNQYPAHLEQVFSFYKNGRPDLRQAFKEVQRRASEIGSNNFSCSFERFKALATEEKFPTDASVREAITVLQGEMLGFYKNAVRGHYGKGVLGVDFKVQGIGQYNHITHVEVKNPVGSKIEKFHRGVSDLDEQGKGIGLKITDQQRKWSDPVFIENLPHVNRSKSFPKEPVNVLSIVDLFDAPKSEKSIIENSVKNNLTNSSSVIFLNNVTNI